MKRTFWLATFVAGVEPARVRAVLRSWLPLVELGCDGVCLVTTEKEYQEEAFRTVGDGWPSARFVTIEEGTFSRSTGRNLAVRFAPADTVVVIDIDCALRGGHEQHVAAAVASLDASTRRIINFLPAWSNEKMAAAFLESEDASALEPTKPYGSWSGLVAGKRADLIELSWDDEMRTWGYEDCDFLERARVGGFELHVPKEAPFVHVWHPSRPDRCRSSLFDNKRRATARLATYGQEGRELVEAMPEEDRTALMLRFMNRAIDEIAMLGMFGASKWDYEPYEASVRRFVRQQCERLGWPGLAALDDGRSTDSLLRYPPLRTVVRVAGFG